ncbi:hypothetical protein [Chitinophaga sp.]|uniref:hypothetical protein n=1 Tax=Chitinophaga sp. TaxID=1869181 RepID=UPI0031E1A084
MIEIIDYSREANPGSVYVIWDMNGEPQEDYAPSAAELLETLYLLGYIHDYTRPDGGTIDVALMIDGRKHWIEWERWLADEISDTLCKDVINHLLIQKHNA